MTDNVAKIKERLDIVELVGSYLKLQKSGINYKGKCPFHNEKTPSFFVNPERQIWHCFGCSLGGDHFEFVQKIEGVDFPEALKMLAKRAGVELERTSPEHQQYQSEKTRLYDICELATRFFEKQLYNSNVGVEVLAYLKDRGLGDESMRKFRLGYAPDSWNAFSDFAVSQGYSADEIVKAGMAIMKNDHGQSSTDSRRIYDRFRNRIIFPVADLSGQVVGFSGRIFEQARASGSPDAAVGTTTSDFSQARVEPDKNQSVVAKYINTPQTAIYDKSKILYGLDKARVDIRTNDRCLVVEGNMDVVMSHQVGANHVVATSGTAITPSHLKIIKRYTDNLDLCFDDDEAGEMATKRGVDLALNHNMNVGIVAFSEKGLKDPADYAKAYGSKWVELSKKSTPFLEFYFSKTGAMFDAATAFGKKMITQKLLPFIKALSNKVEQSHWISELALKVKTKEELLYNELASIKLSAVLAEDNGLVSAKDTGDKKMSGFNIYEEEIAEILAIKPELAGDIDFESDLWSNGLKATLELFKTSGNGVVASKDIELLRFRAGQIWKDFDDLTLKSELDKLIYQVKLRNIQQKMAILGFEIKEAERQGDKKPLTDLVVKFSELSEKLSLLK